MQREVGVRNRWRREFLGDSFDFGHGFSPTVENAQINSQNRARRVVTRYQPKTTEVSSRECAVDGEKKGGGEGDGMRTARESPTKIRDVFLLAVMMIPYDCGERNGLIEKIRIAD